VASPGPRADVAHRSVAAYYVHKFRELSYERQPVELVD
jgi:hypothetical protein